ncbi:MAG: SigF/SigG family RNA polymerase sporulation sigma factor [Lachnospiraceae bacterium]|nr:SigF/SigG family RNA polymerase sporulation sigma factor [Lachnospiraceae bacterium]MDE6699302.1 SigF/SigG family RNA polymerase sporulation sigma factor [Lachnospiraceae bacterium]
MDNLEMIKLAHEGDKEARDLLVNENMGLIWSIVKRFSGRGYEMEDLFQIGCIGILKAIDKFDMSFNVQFSTYAVPMITGEIKRFLRDDGIIKISRTLKENSYKINKTISILSVKLNREPTIDEIATELNMNREEIIMTMESNVEVESIHKTIYQSDGNEIYLVDKLSESGISPQVNDKDIFGDNEKEKLINHMMLKELMDNLKPREKELIILRYFKDKTQMEVAKVLGISQVQVSRMEKKILLKMRSEIV